MTKMPFFSVVMPAYGVEKYFEKAVQSLLSQTYKDFEIIIVDDCSEDKSGEIADRLANEYENISVIHHKVNGGLSAARNTGLEAARGSFVLFMDPDDSVDETLLESAVQALKKQDADVVVFGMIEDFYDKFDNITGSAPIPYAKDTLFLNSAEKVRKEVISLESKTFYGYAWNKFYKRDYLSSIGAKFEDVTLIEDILFNIHVFQELNSLIILNTTPYHYRKRAEGSLTNKFVPDYFELHCKRVSFIYNQYKSWNMLDENVCNILANIFVRYIFSALQRNCDPRSGLNLKAKKQWVEQLFESELYTALIPYASSKNPLIKLMSFILKNRMKYIMLILAGLIYTVKSKFPNLFSKVNLKTRN